MQSITKPPVVLSLAGHDPVGGAGIQADLEAIRANGAWGASALACLTVQDTRGVHSVSPVAPTLFMAQATAVFNDLPVSVMKTGALASCEQVAVVATLSARHPQCRLIIDPVLAGGGGGSLGGESLAQALMEQLIPKALLVTPNTIEATRLTGHSNPEDAAQALLKQGAQAVLITGTHADTPDICHRLYQADQATQCFTNARLPGEYHGSGCTLTAAIAALIARNRPLESACQQGLNYCFSSLQHAQQIGHGQALPDRLWQREAL